LLDPESHCESCDSLCLCSRDSAHDQLRGGAAPSRGARRRRERVWAAGSLPIDARRRTAAVARRPERRRALAADRCFEPAERYDTWPPSSNRVTL
jgi:hypothetical protein